MERMILLFTKLGRKEWFLEEERWKQNEKAGWFYMRHLFQGWREVMGRMRSGRVEELQLTEQYEGRL